MIAYFFFSITNAIFPRYENICYCSTSTPQYRHLHWRRIETEFESKEENEKHTFQNPQIRLIQLWFECDHASRACKWMNESFGNIHKKNRYCVQHLHLRRGWFIQKNKKKIGNTHALFFFHYDLAVSLEESHKRSCLKLK